ncbi:hypothetical protein BDN70DRAFT_901249 [Pholiota conissans]|uniref:Uncharacterized protein n=1 Tax=Pholiota conissans TaxID=109636 RepID=A0A9P6CSY5_9AGAR|nr:hypothetical protein BDN70DRAFT_901249 [Pholiota conissans]
MSSGYRLHKTSGEQHSPIAKKMPGKSWTSDEQAVFLNSLLAEYVSAKSTKKYGPFWSKLRDLWFARWPEHKVTYPDKDVTELTTDERQRVTLDMNKRVAKLQSWYRWKTNPSSKTAQGRGRKSSSLLNMTCKRTHTLKASEMYVKLHGDEKVKPRVMEVDGIEDYTPGRRMALTNRLGKELLELEDDDFKEGIQQEVERTRQEAHNDDYENWTPEQVLSAVEDIPRILAEALEILSDRTGWSFSVLMGAEDIRRRHARPEASSSTTEDDHTPSERASSSSGNTPPPPATNAPSQTVCNASGSQAGSRDTDRNEAESRTRGVHSGDTKQNDQMWQAPIGAVSMSTTEEVGVGEGQGGIVGKGMTLASDSSLTFRPGSWDQGDGLFGGFQSYQHNQWAQTQNLSQQDLSLDFDQANGWDFVQQPTPYPQGIAFPSQYADFNVLITFTGTNGGSRPMLFLDDNGNRGASSSFPPLNHFPNSSYQNPSFSGNFSTPWNVGAAIDFGISHDFGDTILGPIPAIYDCSISQLAATGAVTPSPSSPLDNASNSVANGSSASARIPANASEQSPRVPNDASNPAPSTDAPSNASMTIPSPDVAHNPSILEERTSLSSNTNILSNSSGKILPYPKSLELL